MPGPLEVACSAILARCERGLGDMRSYQADVLVPFLIENPRSAAYVGMGLGKTISLLTVLDHLLSRGLVRKALVVAPVRVAVQTWPTELRLWRHVAWIAHSLIRHDPAAPEVTTAMEAARAEARLDPLGSPQHAAGQARTAAFVRQRERAALSGAPLHIVNREQIAWLVGFHGKDWPYDCVIVDESTSFADHRSQRWKALARVVQRTGRIHLLSGTPAPEGIQDLFAQIYLLDAGVRFGRSITNFRARYMMQNVYTRAFTPQPGAVERVTDLIADIALVMREEDYLDLKAPVVVERPIVLEPAELKAYRKFERDLVLELPDEVQIEAVNAGVLAGKLLQYASGAVYDGERRVHVVHDHKIEEMRELVDELKGEPLLVAYWFKPSLARLQKAFPKAVTMDKEGRCVADWNAGKIPMLFIHPASAGHGLNMQLGPGHILVFYDTPASLELYLQTIKRIARSGQRRLVRVIHLVAQGTLERYAVARLKAKESAQDAVMDRLRELRNRARAA